MRQAKEIFWNKFNFDKYTNWFVTVHLCYSQQFLAWLIYEMPGVRLSLAAQLGILKQNRIALKPKVLYCAYLSVSNPWNSLSTILKLQAQSQPVVCYDAHVCSPVYFERHRGLEIDPMTFMWVINIGANDKKCDICRIK